VIITDILRGKLAFEGIVVTDGMTMQGVTDQFSPAEAAIGAIDAGADVVLVPADFAQAYNGVLRAAQSGRISRDRLDESVRRVLAAKQWVGLDRARFVNVENISSVVGAPQSEIIADSMFSAALTLLRNQGGLVPLPKKSRVHVVTVTDEPNLQAGDALRDALVPYVQSVALSHLWNESRTEASASTVAQLQSADVVVVGTYLSVGSWKGQLGFSSEIQKFLGAVGRIKKPVVTVAFGDPYVLGKLPTTDAMIAMYTGVRKAEEAVANALGGAAEVQGHLPVTIPGKFNRGDGIHLSPVSRSGR
jgi:beta-N-acetylhexosaminidase